MPYERNKRFPELFRNHEGAPWWAFVPNPRGGRALRIPTRQTDERAAHARYLEIVRAPHGPAVEAEGKKERTLRDALADRIEWLRVGRQSDDPSRKKLAADTIDFYDKKSAPLLALLGRDTLLSEIGHEEIRRYIVERSKTVKATTIAKEFATLSMASRLARKDGVNAPLFSDIVPEDFAVKYVPRTRWLPEREVDAMLSALAPKRRPVFAFLVCTGATYPSEVAPSRPDHVRGHVVHLLGKKRDARDRYVHVPAYGRRFLKIALEGLGPFGFEPWQNVRRDLHVAAAHAKIAPMSPNDLRRTFAQWLVRSGVPYELAAPMMGHGSTKMLEQVYGRRDAGTVAKLVELALRNAPKNARQA